MTPINGTQSKRQKFELNKDDFNPTTMDDALRVDRLCQILLREFYESLLATGVNEVLATALANSADYFVRDFVVDYKSLNLFIEQNGLVRQFAGNWYILSTIDPQISQLSGHLQGIASFYRFLNVNSFISDTYLQSILKECEDIPFYEERIKSFWDISSDGYLAWEKECSLKGEQ